MLDSYENAGTRPSPAWNVDRFVDPRDPVAYISPITYRVHSFGAYWFSFSEEKVLTRA